jgi:hypothetical protein
MKFDDMILTDEIDHIDLVVHMEEILAMSMRVIFIKKISRITLPCKLKCKHSQEKGPWNSVVSKSSPHFTSVHNPWALTIITKHKDIVNLSVCRLQGVGGEGSYPHSLEREGSYHKIHPTLKQ